MLFSVKCTLWLHTTFQQLICLDRAIITPKYGNMFKKHVHKHERHKINAHTVAANSFFSICQINLKCILKSSTMRFILHRKVILGTHLIERRINSNILTSSFQRLLISIKQTFGRNVTLSHFMPQIYQWNDNRPTCF